MGLESTPGLGKPMRKEWLMMLRELKVSES
jgi:hypothetical protein